MQSPPRPPRVLFLDMMRFIALVMMLQGHTVYAVLEHDIRDGDSPGIAVWRFFRGYTAPVFMTVAGVVFTYLLVLAGEDRGQLARRLRHGGVRVATLLAWGYALRLPMEGLWAPVSQRRLDVGLAIDVLQLIGFGLLMIVTVFLACRPMLRRGVERIAWVFLLLFIGFVQVSPYVGERSFHREAAPLFSGDVSLASASDIEGVAVRDVRDGSRARGAGLRSGDVITRIGTVAIADVDDIRRAEASQKPEHPSAIRVVREGQPMDIPWTHHGRARVFPNAVTFWMNDRPAPSGIASQFPIFPWCAYLLFGAVLGAALAGMNRRHAIPRLLDLILLGMAAAWIAWGGAADGFGRAWLGGGESAIVFQRLGGVLVLAAAMVFLSRWIKRLPPLVIQMSRNSLWLYIGHLVLLYTIRPWIYRGKFEVAGTLACVALMFALMIVQTLLIEKKQALGSWGRTLRVLTSARRIQKSK